ncbi:MAG: hypothetical protein JXA67_07160, partial [Micromonosporaceae bacterium]|nr:hypothetical protein [Micromonosporaceae bacterium]
VLEPAFASLPTREMPVQATPAGAAGPEAPRRRGRLTRRVLAGAGIVAVVGGCAVAITHRHAFIPVDESQFTRDTAAVRPVVSERRARGSTIVPNPDGTVRYLYEDFDEYGDVNSRLIDGMEQPANRRLIGGGGTLSRNSDAIQGQRSLAVRLETGGTPVVLHTDLPAPVDLSRWTAGYLTAWLRVTGRKGIGEISIVLGDDAGRTRQIAPLPNLQSDYPNHPRDNDPFPDLTYPETTHAAEWTDFQVVPGWNYLPWRLDTGSTASPDFAASRVSWYEITIATTGALKSQTVLLDNLRIQDGLQKAANPLAGNWHAPLGMPQYGVLDIDRTGSGLTGSGQTGAGQTGDWVLNLRNVRQRQYPSNGDHGRILSKWGTPVNFAFRTRLTLNRLGSDTNNTWLRVFYDFEPDYDPGHDWFGGYCSLDYDIAGVLTVIPLERFSSQGQEPEQTKDYSQYRKPFEAQEHAVYEYDLTVRGQRIDVTIYEVRKDKLYQRIHLEHTFDRQRRTDRRYPFGLEITGNVTATVSSMELVQL